jgi:hypothetical protein
MEGKTLGERNAWEKELKDGKREATIYDVAWLLLELAVTTDKWKYYMNMNRRPS